MILPLAGIIDHIALIVTTIIGMTDIVVTGTIVGVATTVIVAESIIEPIVLRFVPRGTETIELGNAVEITNVVVRDAERVNNV